MITSEKGVKGMLPLGCLPLWGREGVTLLYTEKGWQVTGKRGFLLSLIKRKVLEHLFCLCPIWSHYGALPFHMVGHHAMTSPGMITEASSPAPRNDPAMICSLSIPGYQPHQLTGIFLI
jgi:hypothetical protein